nr:nuclear transport factor 2 family protein [Streptomyces sp. SID3343]
MRVRGRDAGRRGHAPMLDAWAATTGPPPWGPPDNVRSEMSTLPRSLTTEKAFVAYLTEFPREMGFEDEDPQVIMDRYYTPDFEQYTDGLCLDRAKLAAHVVPVRKRVETAHVAVHDAMVAGDRVSARFTMHALTKKGKILDTEVYMFGRLAADGRLCRIDQITRIPDAG